MSLVTIDKFLGFQNGGTVNVNTPIRLQFILASSNLIGIHTTHACIMKVTKPTKFCWICTNNSLNCHQTFLLSALGQDGYVFTLVSSYIIKWAFCPTMHTGNPHTVAYDTTTQLYSYSECVYVNSILFYTSRKRERIHQGLVTDLTRVEQMEGMCVVVCEVQGSRVASPQTLLKWMFQVYPPKQPLLTANTQTFIWYATTSN